MCMLEGIPENTQAWKRLECIFQENILDLSKGPLAGEIYAVYMMTDAIESILVFEQAVMTGTFDKDYKGEINGSITTLEEGYMLVVRQGQDNAFTIRFQNLRCEEKQYTYHDIGHFWMKDYEMLRRINYQIGLIFEKATFLGEEYCNEKELSLLPFYEFAPLRRFICVYWEKEEQYTTTKEAVEAMLALANEANDRQMQIMLKKYQRIVDRERKKRILCAWHEKRIMKMLNATKHRSLIECLEKKIVEASILYEKPSFGTKNDIRIAKCRKKLQGKYPNDILLEERPFCIGENFRYTFHVCRLENKRGQVILQRKSYTLD